MTEPPTGRFGSHQALHHEAPVWNADQAVQPGFCRERHRDVLLAVKRATLVIREDQPGTGVFLALERLDDDWALRSRLAGFVMYSYLRKLDR